MTDNITAVVLASGQSLRFGKQNKLLYKINNREIILHTINNIYKSGIKNIIIVAGFEYNKIYNIINKNYDDIIIIENNKYKEGMSESIKLGINYIEKKYKEYKNIAFFLGDMPYIKPMIIKKIIEKFLELKNKMIVVPEYNNQSGHPVIINKSFVNELYSLNGDIGLRKLISKNNSIVKYFSVSNNSIIHDIDTVEDIK